MWPSASGLRRVVSCLQGAAEVADLEMTLGSIGCSASMQLMGVATPVALSRAASSGRMAQIRMFLSCDADASRRRPARHVAAFNYGMLCFPFRPNIQQHARRKNK